jgi:hypothetical protein
MHACPGSTVRRRGVGTGPTHVRPVEWIAASDHRSRGTDNIGTIPTADGFGRIVPDPTFGRYGSRFADICPIWPLTRSESGEGYPRRPRPCRTCHDSKPRQSVSVLSIPRKHKMRVNTCRVRYWQTRSAGVSSAVTSQPESAFAGRDAEASHDRIDTVDTESTRRSWVPTVP